MIPKLIEKEKKVIVQDNTILLGYRGSVAHNMYIPNTNPNSIDDVDVMGVFLAPVDYYLGLKRIKETNSFFLNQWDVVKYELKKFVFLLLNCNPNVLSLLWLEPEHYIETSYFGNLLIENRSIFVSKKAYRAFAGYAAGQLRKMDHSSTEGYMGEKRKKLVEKFGYDCKNAAHCIRLLKMAEEFLLTGKLNVFRKNDSEFLLSIKRGDWPLNAVKSEAERLFDRVKRAKDESSLPEEPNFEKANEIVRYILNNYTNEVIAYGE